MKQKIAFVVIEKRDSFPLQNSSEPFLLLVEIKIDSNAVSQTADDSLFSFIIIDKLVFQSKLAHCVNAVPFFLNSKYSCNAENANKNN